MVGAFFVADHAQAVAVEAAEPADEGVVVAELAVAGERGEIGQQRRHIVEAVRPLRMARHLGFLPGRQRRVELLQRRVGLAFEPGDLLADGDRVAGLLERAQLLDLRLQFGDRLFEIEIASHHSSLDASPNGWRSRTRLLRRSSSTWV